MPSYTDDEDLREGVRPLSKREAAWIARLERVLLACPTKRLHMVTIGDSYLTVVDGLVARAEDLDLSDGGADRNGVALALVSARTNIHGVSG